MDSVVKLTYSPKHILAILDRYMSIDDGEFGNGQSPEPNYRVNKDIYRAPFEDSIISKADIDIAIDRLGAPGRWQTWCKDIGRHPRRYSLTPKQHKIALYIRGSNSPIKSIARELSAIA